MKFALFFGNRGFFPGELIESAREEVKEAVEKQGHEVLILPAELTRYGAVETSKEGRTYANFLKENEGRFDGVILSLPNFGDENGAIAALKDCGVPILIQAYPDEIGKMDFSHRRDAYCGKFSIMDVFYQNNLPFTIFEPHVIHPPGDTFASHIEKFAAVCRIVKGMKRFTVGAIGARTSAFKTVRFDELALQDYDITTETVDLSEVFARVGKVDDKKVTYKDKLTMLKGYSDWSIVPEGKMELIAKLGIVFDEIIEEFGMDCVAIRCWDEIEKHLGISPCVLLSEMNDRGIVAACELDVCNAVSMRALALASEKAATCLDWNNNYGDDEDKCILFHCGPVPKSLMEEQSGHITEHPMFKKAYGEGCGWGCNEGRIARNDMTFMSAKTEKGKLVFYFGEGKFTGDPIEEGFFGCAGVAQIQNLQGKLKVIGKQGFRHHVSVSTGHHVDTIKEAFETYLGYEIIKI
jgi:L-fucose isomerase-like protein